MPLEDSVERKALVPDHGWAEVMRFATNCSAVAEGLSTGFNTDCGKRGMLNLAARASFMQCEPSTS